MITRDSVYQYVGKPSGDVPTGAMVVYISDTVNIGLVHVRDTSTQKTAVVAKKDLKETKLLNDDMQQASNLTAMMEGLKAAMEAEQPRPVAMTFVGEDNQVRHAIYALDDIGRLSMVNAQLFYAAQTLQHFAQIYRKPVFAATASSLVATGFLVGKALDELEGKVVH
jgi:hypothetical protein